MNVLVIFSFKNSFFTWQEVGNLDREIEFYNHFSKTYKANFTFLTYGDRRDKEILNEIGQHTVIPIYELIKKSKYKIINIIKSFYLPFLLRKKLKNIDVIKCVQLNGSWVGVIFKLLLRKPLYVKTGYDAYIFSKKEKKTKIKILLFYLLTQFVLVFTNMYTVASIHDLNFIEKKYLIKNPKKIFLRPNWVLSNKNNKSFSERKKQIITIGRLANQKNYPFLITALGGSGYTLDIVGSGELKDELEALAIKSNTNVNFLGNINNNELIQTLRNYKFFILPSFFEGNPKVVLEAMAAGCIVLVSSIPNNTEIIKDRKNGYVFSISKILKRTNEKEIVEILNTVSQSELEKVRQNSLNDIENKYLMQKWCEVENEDLISIVYSRAG